MAESRFAWGVAPRLVNPPEAGDKIPGHAGRVVGCLSDGRSGLGRARGTALGHSVHESWDAALMLQVCSNSGLSDVFLGTKCVRRLFETSLSFGDFVELHMMHVTANHEQRA